MIKNYHMKNLLFYLLLISTLPLFSQQTKQDTTRLQNLEEVIVSSIRVKKNAPIGFTNVSSKTKFPTAPKNEIIILFPTASIVAGISGDQVFPLSIFSIAFS